MLLLIICSSRWLKLPTREWMDGLGLGENVVWLVPEDLTFDTFLFCSLSLSPLMIICKLVLLCLAHPQTTCPSVVQSSIQFKVKTNNSLQLRRGWRFSLIRVLE